MSDFCLVEVQNTIIASFLPPCAFGGQSGDLERDMGAKNMLCIWMFSWTTEWVFLGSGAAVASVFSECGLYRAGVWCKFNSLYTRFLGMPVSGG